MALYENEREEQFKNFRQEMERRHREEEVRRYYERLDREKSRVSAPASKMLERKIRGEISHDPIGKEARKEFLAFQAIGALAGGAALLVASAAAEAIYNKHVDDSIRRINNNYESTYNAKMDAITGSGDGPISYDKYSRKVTEMREDLIEHNPGIIDRYQEASRIENDGLKNAYNQHNAEQKSINDAHSEEVQRINSTMSGDEKISALAQAEANRASALKASDDAYKDQVDKFAMSAKNTAERMATSETNKYTAHVTRPDKDDRPTRDNKPDRPDKPGHLTIKEQRGLDKDDLREYKKVHREEMKEYKALKKDYKEQIQEYKAQKEDYKTRRHESKGESLVRAVDKANKSLGHDLAMALGSKEEKELLALAEKEKQAKKADREKGIPHVPLASPQEIERAKQIASSYTGSIANQKELSKTIHNLTVASSDLNKLLKSKNDDLKSTNNRIAALEKAIKNGETTPEILQELKDKKALAKSLSKDMHSLNELKRGTNDQLENLKKNGKFLTDVGKGKQVPISVLGGLLKNADNEPLIQLKFLPKIKKKEEAGKSKTAANAQKAAMGMMFKSFGALDREFKKSAFKGNALHNEIFGDARKAAMLARKYDMAIAAANIGFKVLMFTPGLVKKSVGKVFMKHGGKQRERWADFLKHHPKFNKFFTKTGRFGKAFGNTSKAIGGSLLKLPSSILKAPMKVMNAPEDLARGAAKLAFKATRKAAGLTYKGAKGTVKLAGKAAGKTLKFVGRNTFGRIKFFQNLGDKFSLFGKRVGSFFGRIGATGEWFKNMKKKAASFFMKIGTAILSFITTLIGIFFYILGIAMIGVLVVVIILGIVSAIAAAWAAFTQWLYSQTSDYDTRVQYQPEFIINQAINYRNAELDLLELFHKAKSKQYNIDVNESPIYYALYDNLGTRGLGETILHWFGFDGEKEQTSYNNEALLLITGLATEKNFNLEKFTENGTQLSWWEKLAQKVFSMDVLTPNFKYTPVYYDSVKLQYYTTDQLQRDSDGTYSEVERNGYKQSVLKPGAKASEYEISNAKDALAIVDTLYQEDQEKMQTGEVLMYLGVGDYQVGKKETTSTDVKTGNVTNNLFWLTHHIMYNSGNAAEDIWYHKTVQNVHNPDEYVIDHNSRYTTSTITDSKAPYGCNHNQVLGFDYNTGTRTVYAHQSVGDFKVTEYWNSSIYSDFDVTEAVGTAGNEFSRTSYKMIDISQAYYLFYSKLYSDKNDPISSGSADITITTNVTVKPGRPTPIAPRAAIVPVYEETNKAFKAYAIGQNVSTSNALNALHVDSTCDKLTFFRSTANEYYVINNNGNYMGKMNLAVFDNGAVKNLITQFSINETIEQINTRDDGMISLDCFYLVWDSSKSAYVFNVISAKDLDSTKTDPGLMTIFIDELVINASRFNMTISKFFPTNIKIACSHTSEEPLPQEIKFNVCKGHIDLDVAIAVSTHENNDIFVDAAGVTGLDETYTVEHFLWIFTLNSEHNVYGWGIAKFDPFSPKDDWSNHQEHWQSAAAKTEGIIEYPIESGQSISDKSILINHWINGGINKFDSLKTSTDGVTLYGMQFNGTTYYVNDFYSGEQSKMDYYLNSDGNGYKKQNNTLSFVLSADGLPTAK